MTPPPPPLTGDARKALPFVAMTYRFSDGAAGGGAMPCFPSCSATIFSMTARSIHSPTGRNHVNVTRAPYDREPRVRPVSPPLNRAV